MQRLIVSVCVFVALSLLSTSVRAADEKHSATGTWTWSFTTQNGQTIESKLKLKQEGDKVTGTYKGRGNTESEVEDGKVKDDEISFTVNREFNGNKFTMKYHGKLEGDTIKGKIEMGRDGQTQERDWEAKRAKDDDKDKDKEKKD